MRQIKVNKETFTPRITKASGLYLNEVDRTKIMTPEEEAEVAYLASKGDGKARNKLINANLRFVITVAKNYARNPEDFSEIVAVGNIGLVEAAEVFDPSRGFKFISFAVWHIRKQILKHLSDNGRLVRLPQNQIKNMKALSEASNRIFMEEGREANPREAFDLLQSEDDGFSSVRYDNVLCAYSADLKPSSFDNPLSDETGSQTLLDILDSGSYYADEESDRLDSEFKFSELINVLNPMETEIVLRKHSIEPYDNSDSPYVSYSQISEDMGLGVSGEVVRLRYMKAIRKMKFSAIKKGLNKVQSF